MSDAGASGTFEIGLVMAGAISAGAYSAGVVDFLIEALDAWQAAKDRNEPGVPRHSACLRVISGASAGGMTAAMLASLAGRDFEHVRSANPDGDPDNPMYRAWVRQIDAARLLDLQDLRERDGPVTSLLDATALDEIGRQAFTVLRPRQGRRKYFCPGVKLLLSVANLRGVPYRIRFAGTEDGHGIMLHKDFVQFVIDPPDEPEFGEVLRSNQITPEAWQKLQDAALASGAFPLGLRPRVLSRRAGEYAKWRWAFPPLESKAPDRDGDGRPDRDEVLPSWTLAADHDYRFCCVDGGLMDNEPLELARRELIAGSGRTSNAGDRAHWALVMVDPFPEPPDFDADYAADDADLLDPVKVFGSMLVGLRNQARFKVDELLLANEESVYSRYMISPVRHERTGAGGAEERVTPAAACGAMGAFGGFLDRSFREHDYQLGRRNAQQFLRRHFVLMENNPVVQQWSLTADAEPHFVRRPDGSYERDKDGAGVEQRLLPIVPLMPHLREPIASPQWPTYDRGRLEALRPLLRRRIAAVGRRLIHQRLTGLTKYFAAAAFRLKADAITDRLVRMIDNALVRHRQLEPSAAASGVP